MSWDTFTKLHMLDLFNLWILWVPEKENNNTLDEENAVLYSYYDEEEEDFYDLVDEGNRVTSFRYFLHFAYENSI